MANNLSLTARRLSDWRQPGRVYYVSVPPAGGEVGSRGISLYKAVNGAGAKVEDPPLGGAEIPLQRCKNHDNLSRFIGKPINQTVRVMLWRLLIVMMLQSRCLRSCSDWKKLNYWMLSLSNFLVFINP